MQPQVFPGRWSLQANDQAASRLADRLPELKQIKARYPEMTVIMLTNFDNAQYRRQCRLLGADHFLNKTLEFEKIVETITGHPVH